MTKHMNTKSNKKSQTTSGEKMGLTGKELFGKQRSLSNKPAASQLKGGCSENTEYKKVEIDKNAWNDIGDGFWAVGNNGKFSLVFAGNVVSAKGFETAAEAKKYKDSKPWEVILIATAIYADKVKEVK